MMRVDYLATMSKSAARKRLSEASTKVAKVYLEGSYTILSVADRAKLVKINEDLSRLIIKLR